MSEKNQVPLSKKDSFSIEKNQIYFYFVSRSLVELLIVNIHRFIHYTLVESSVFLYTTQLMLQFDDKLSNYYVSNCTHLKFKILLILSPTVIVAVSFCGNQC